MELSGSEESSRKQGLLWIREYQKQTDCVFYQILSIKGKDKCEGVPILDKETIIIPVIWEKKMF